MRINLDRFQRMSDTLGNKLPKRYQAQQQVVQEFEKLRSYVDASIRQVIESNRSQADQGMRVLSMQRPSDGSGQGVSAQLETTGRGLNGMKPVSFDLTTDKGLRCTYSHDRYKQTWTIQGPTGEKRFCLSKGILTL